MSGVECGQPRARGRFRASSYPELTRVFLFFCCRILSLEEALAKERTARGELESQMRVELTLALEVLKGKHLAVVQNMQAQVPLPYPTPAVYILTLHTKHIASAYLWYVSATACGFPLRFAARVASKPARLHHNNNEKTI